MYQKTLSYIEEFHIITMLQNPDVVILRIRNKEEPNGMACCAEIGLQQMSVKFIEFHTYYSNSLLNCHYHPFT